MRKISPILVMLSALCNAASFLGVSVWNQSQVSDPLVRLLPDSNRKVVLCKPGHGAPGLRDGDGCLTRHRQGIWRARRRRPDRIAGKR